MFEITEYVVSVKHLVSLAAYAFRASACAMLLGHWCIDPQARHAHGLCNAPAGHLSHLRQGSAAEQQLHC